MFAGRDALLLPWRANALAAGVTLPEAATLARHANARTTAIVYAGITEAARDAIAAKLLGAGLGA